jgi:hypothetical protein
MRATPGDFAVAAGPRPAPGPPGRDAHASRGGWRAHVPQGDAPAPEDPVGDSQDRSDGAEGGGRVVPGADDGQPAGAGRVGRVPDERPVVESGRGEQAAVRREADAIDDVGVRWQCRGPAGECGAGGVPDCQRAVAAPGGQIGAAGVKGQRAGAWRLQVRARVRGGARGKPWLAGVAQVGQRDGVARPADRQHVPVGGDSAAPRSPDPLADPGQVAERLEVTGVGDTSSATSSGYL